MTFSINARSCADMPVEAAGLGGRVRRSRGAILSQKNQTAATPPRSVAIVARSAITTSYDRSIVPVQPSGMGAPLQALRLDKAWMITTLDDAAAGRLEVLL